MSSAFLTKLAALVTPPEPDKARLDYKVGATWTTMYLQFNPGSLSISRSAKWDDGNETGAAYETLRFSGGEVDQMSFDAIIDETMPPTSSSAKALAMQMLSPVTTSLTALGFMSKHEGSVLDWADRLVYLTLPSQTFTDKHGSDWKRPPLVRFRWGDTDYFKGAVTEIELKIELFDTDGRPVRATASIKMKGRYVASSLGTDHYADGEIFADQAPKKSKTIKDPGIKPKAVGKGE